MTIKEIPMLRPVVIQWRDSKIYYGQTSSDDRYECEFMKTCGFWLGYSELSALVARDLVGDEHRGVIAIPNENIVSIKAI